jgi:TatD DNase family protein
MAVKIGKPVIVHCREAGEDVFSILEEERVWRVGGVVHCFTGDAELARKLLGLDLHLGAAGPITFENSNELRSVFADIPIERILVETDSPYLTPPPNRGKRNEPAYTVQVAEKLAEIKGLTLEDVARATSVNVRRLFKIGPCPVPGTIAYPLAGKLYLNITNRCDNACLFCGLLSDRVFMGHDLTLESDPGVEAILEAAGDPGSYEEVVFSGYGEPTTRLEDLKQVALELRGRGAKRIRLATNGLGNRVNGRSILPELQGLIDAISVSLQAESPEAYEKVCKTKEIENPYPSVKEFVSEAKRLFGDVEVTAVDMPGIIDIEACEKVAREELNVSFRRHSFALAD